MLLGATELFSVLYVLFLDWLFHVCSLGLPEFRSALHCLVYFYLGLCFGLGLLQVPWNMKSTASFNSALF